MMRNSRAPTWREHSVSFLELFTFISLSSKLADLRPGVGAPKADVVRRNDLKSKIRYFQFLNVEHQVLTLFLIDHQFNELAFDVPKVYTGLSSLVTSNYDTPPLIPAL